MAKYPIGLLEEKQKNKVATDRFAAFNTMRIVGKADFFVAVAATELGLFESENALWAEPKAGVRKDIHENFGQQILTIGRADGENNQIGFLTTTDAPYPKLVEAARDVASHMYERRYKNQFSKEVC